MALPQPSTDFHETVFEAIPLPIFIVDDDLSIIDFNVAAAQLSEPAVLSALRPRAGEAVHCIHAERAGCGNSTACRGCILRNSVKETFEGQSRATKRPARMLLRKGDGIDERDFVVTTAPFRDGSQQLALLILDDVKGLSL